MAARTPAGHHELAGEIRNCPSGSALRCTAVSVGYPKREWWVWYDDDSGSFIVRLPDGLEEEVPDNGDGDEEAAGFFDLREGESLDVETVERREVPR